MLKRRGKPNLSMAHMSNPTITPADIVNAVKVVPKTAKSEKWLFTYDPSEGSFYYSPRQIDRQAELFQVNEEFAIYLDKKTKAPKGVMVEYYKVNFLEHHPEFKLLDQTVFDAANENVQEATPDNNPDNNAAYSLKVFFERTMLDEAQGGFSTHPA